MLLAECEKANAELAEQRAAKEKARANKRSKTTAELLTDALAAFIDERLHEQE